MARATSGCRAPGQSGNNSLLIGSEGAASVVTAHPAASRHSTTRESLTSSILQHLPQDGLQDASVLVIGEFDFRIDSHVGLKHDWLSVIRSC